MKLDSEASVALTSQHKKKKKKKNQKTNLIKYQNTQKTVLIVIHIYSYVVILMPK